MASAPTRFVLPSGVTITPDTCTATQQAYTAEATTHPVEDGSSIADHVIRKPAGLSFTTTWTPRPPDDSYQPSPGNDRPMGAFVFLSETLQMRTPIRIVTDGVTYDPVVLTSVTMPRAFEDGDGRTITIEAQEIQIVSGKTVKIRVSKSNGFKGKAKKKKTNVTFTRGDAAISAAAAVFTGNYLQAAGFVALAVK
jgi:hypothetical protein